MRGEAESVLLQGPLDCRRESLVLVFLGPPIAKDR
jgi:hypothetical protein